MDVTDQKRVGNSTPLHLERSEEDEKLQKVVLQNHVAPTSTREGLQTHLGISSVVS